MEELTSPTRRTLLTAAAAGLATPVIGAAAQPAELRQEGGKFNLWVGHSRPAEPAASPGMVRYAPIAINFRIAAK
jgi:hypothetical protein